MDFFNRKQTVIWTIIILIVLNLLTLSTVWFSKHHPPRPPHHDKHDRVQMNDFDFITKELKLDDEQVKAFVKAREEHFSQMNIISEEIHMARKAIFDEVFKSEPENNMADSFASIIGQKHKDLEKLNFHHFMLLKSICNPDQQQKLNIFLQEMQHKQRSLPHSPGHEKNHPPGKPGKRKRND